jgi:hypothetical protein
MTVTVNIDDASLHELLAKVEAGEEVIIMRDGAGGEDGFKGQARAARR